MPRAAKLQLQRSLRYTAGAVVLAETPVPQLGGAGDVLVRLDVGGLCRTDLYVAQGKLSARPNVVLGHEASGVVVERGDAAAVGVGTRVALDPRVPCGRCATCARPASEPAPCLTPDRLGVELDGVFAEYVAVPAANAIPLAADVDPTRAAYLEPVAAALGALEPIPRHARGVIAGSGRIAELTARLFEVHGRPRPAVLSPADLRASGQLFSYVIDAGLPTDDALAAMTGAVLPGGTLVLKSRAVEPRRFLPADWVGRDLRVTAIAYGNFHRAAELLADPRLELADLFGPLHPLESFDAVLREATSHESVKQFFSLRPS